MYMTTVSSMVEKNALAVSSKSEHAEEGLNQEIVFLADQSDQKVPAMLQRLSAGSRGI